MRAADAQAGELAEGKRLAAEWAAELVETAMMVGLGTGCTAVFALRRIAKRLGEGSLTDVRGIPTSEGAGPPPPNWASRSRPWKSTRHRSDDRWG